MRKIILGAFAALVTLTASAQGHNTGCGGHDGNFSSLAERVLGLEKKTDAFNFYLNYASSFQMSGVNPGNDWGSAFRAKQLRLEIKGAFGDHLTYRIRHRLNRGQGAMSNENFAKATDIMMVGWKFNDQWSLMGGKLCQFWGGIEFDENPMYIYEYSDMLNCMDNFLGGAALSWHPLPNHEFVLNISNSYSSTFSDEYGGMPVTWNGDAVEAAKHPLAYVFNWNGTMFDGMLETRWGVGFYNQAKDCKDKMVMLGQRLVLPNVQWYIDYMGAWEDIDRLRFASAELGGLQTKVAHQSLVTKVNWQFAPGWNLMGKGMYETTSTEATDGTYRTALGYVASLEYYPVADQDFRVFCAFVGRDYKFKDVPLHDYHTNRIELGFMYRIKCY